MAAIPSAKERFSDGKLSVVKAASTTPVIIGPASSGTANVLTMFSDAAAAETAHGDGAGLIGLGEVLAEVSPAGFVKCATSVAASVSAVTASGGATGTLTVTGDATYDFDKVVVEILSTGVKGVATFRYSLDAYSGDTEAERTYSETLVTPSGTTFLMPRSGLTLSFDSTSPTVYTAGDSYTFSAKAASSNASDIGTAIAAAIAAGADWRFTTIVTTADVTAAEHALIGAAVEAALDAAEVTPKYRQALMASGGAILSDAAAAITSIGPLSHEHTAYVFGAVRLVAARSFPGFAFPKVFSVIPVAGRCAKLLPSTDVKRVASGALSRVVKTFHDELVSPSTLDDYKIGTLRTWAGQEGVFVTQLRPKSGAGSDLEKWPDLTVLQMAREITHAASVSQIGKGFRTVTSKVGNTSYPGVIDPRDRAKIELAANKNLRSQLLTPTNEEGVPGFVEDVVFTVSEIHDYKTSKKIVGSLRIKKLDSADYVDVDVSFTA